MKIPEKFLQLVWHHQLFHKSNLQSTENKPIQIINKGKYNFSSSGPDFTEAVINYEGMKWSGSIEIETNSNHWYLHEHDRNPAFNNVILLVCYEHHENKILNSNGLEVPVLVIKPYILADAIEKLEILMHQEVPCKFFLKDVPRYIQKETLTQQAIARLEQKVNYFKTDDIEQLSWKMLWKAFGAPYHTEIFVEISENITPDVFFACDQQVEKEALTFGGAGFLLGDYACSYFKQLKEIWNYLQSKYNLKEIALRPINFKTRYHSYPNVLMAQLVAWLHVHGNALLNPSEFHFENFGEISAYWKKHLFFEKPSKVQVNIGEQKLLKLLLNWYYPFRWYYCKRYEPEGVTNIIDSFTSTCKEINHIIQKMEKWGWKFENGMETQGATHLYKNFCVEKRCLECNIGRCFIQIRKQSKERENIVRSK